MLNKLKQHLEFYRFGKKTLANRSFKKCSELSQIELAKKPSRTQIINFLIASLNRETTYLEIGVSNPEYNYNHIISEVKYSVDPGYEFKSNPVDYKMTSDEFFSALDDGQILSADMKFDVIFIDGLHLAIQAHRDVQNALQYLCDDGFIVMHDCNPPSFWHAREEYYDYFTPASGYWNGTTWKAFLKWRTNENISSCCIDTDWGVGILTKGHNLGEPLREDLTFFDYYQFDTNRRKWLNLISFDELTRMLANNKD